MERLLRDARRDDFATVLALNDQFVGKLSPLSLQRLNYLHEEAALHRVVEQNEAVVAFLLAFTQEAQYDSPNFVWFAHGYESFLYIDRVVVAASSQGSGLGTRLYRDAFAFASRESIPTVVCEFDVEPPNPASEHFHAKLGFREVGRHRVAGGTKLVSLQAMKVEATSI